MTLNFYGTLAPGLVCEQDIGRRGTFLQDASSGVNTVWHGNRPKANEPDINQKEKPSTYRYIEYLT